MDGKWTAWDENGQKRVDFNYKDGKEHGKSTEWDESGQTNWKWEGNWKAGKMDGKWNLWDFPTLWDENGQMEREKYYKDGECISGDCD